MAADLSFLKGLPCRKGENQGECDNPTACLFSHKTDENHRLDGEPLADQDGPRKRLKSVTASAEHDPTSPVLPGQTRPVPERVVVRTAETAVSPPPVKRKLPVASAISVKATAPANPSTASSAPISARKTAAARPPSHASSPRKAESLNPRHLSSAPASHEMRLRLLELLHSHLVRLNKELRKDASEDEEKLVLSDQQLVWMALDEEEKFAKEKPEREIYSNTFKHRIIYYKKLPVATWKAERLQALNKLKGLDKAAKGRDGKGPLGPPVVLETGLTPRQELAVLARLRTPIDDKAKWGYVPKVPTDEDIQKAREGEEISRGFEVCDRCSTRFQVFPGRREDGALTSGGKCTHHPGRAYFVQKQAGEKTFGGNAKQYRCCGQTVGDSAGCTTGETHVFKTTDAKRLALVWNFAETPPNPDAPDDRAVCFDCEMGYTSKGLELIRVTATSWPDGKELLDVLVRPMGEVLDLNSRYSGVYPDDIANALPYSAAGDALPPAPIPPAAAEGQRKRLQRVSSPLVARDLLFSLLSPDTPLMGHGLENDLNTMRIVHPTVVDTVLLFPHNRGLPLRNGLKYLMETQLNRRIQVEDREGQLAGHDSGEDARAAGDLVRLKVKHEWELMRRLGWTAVEGGLVPPRRSQRLTEEALEAMSEA